MASIRAFRLQSATCKLSIKVPICSPENRIRSSAGCLQLTCTSFPHRYPRKSFLIKHFATAQLQTTTQQNSSPIPRFDNTSLAEMVSRVDNLLKSPAVPRQDSIEGALADCEIYARALYDSAENVEVSLKDGTTPASTLLSLEKKQQQQQQQQQKQQQGHTIAVQSIGLTRSTREKVIERLSTLAYSIVTDPKTFIAPTALASYVATQCLLGRPETLSQVFVLYANKPIPRPGSSPAQFKPSKPSKASSAVPYVVSHAALSAAIDAKNLPLCFDIINTSVCTTAFKRNKLVRRALLPATALALAPIAAYSTADHLAAYQGTMDNTLARNLIFAGTVAYVGFTAIIGFVAVTTGNDQMKRITWASGIPLRERWLREEERALIDRVALSWGFQEEMRRGEEEGQDWEALREWVGLRGMILDRVSLMEGME